MQSCHFKLGAGEFNEGLTVEFLLPFPINLSQPLTLSVAIAFPASKQIDLEFIFVCCSSLLHSFLYALEIPENKIILSKLFF